MENDALTIRAEKLTIELNVAVQFRVILDPLGGTGLG